MWVRGQNGSMLLEVKKILVFEYKEYKFTPDNAPVGWAIQEMMSIETYIDLGIYSTKEQAIDVLDEIQERINEGCPYVYEMPEDEPIQLDNELLEYAKQKREEAEEAIKKFKEGLKCQKI